MSLFNYYFVGEVDCIWFNMLANQKYFKLNLLGCFNGKIECIWLSYISKIKIIFIFDICMGYVPSIRLFRLLLSLWV